MTKPPESISLLFPLASPALQVLIRLNVMPTEKSGGGQHTGPRTSKVSFRGHTSLTPLGHLLKLRSLGLHPIEPVVVTTVPAVQLGSPECAVGSTEPVAPSHALTFKGGSVADAITHLGDLGSGGAGPCGDDETRGDGELHSGRSRSSLTLWVGPVDSPNRGSIYTFTSPSFRASHSDFHFCSVCCRR